MKIVVLGGYGVFGSRLVRLLCRDGHEVVIAGRSVALARALANEVQATVLQVDRAGDLSMLWALKPDAVVDAAGPFHAYGTDPYRLVRACIDHRVHYLDLADNAAFCAGIVCLDQSARAAGVVALSGVSSVPALSSAAVAALSQGADRIDLISTSILPGNRAPRGRSVVSSILNQCGQPFDMMTDGIPVPTRSWSQPERFDLSAGISRRGWLIEVPDNQLFADAFGAGSVQFRAGLELEVMNRALAVMSWVRGRLCFGMPKWMVSLMLGIAKLLSPWGTDAGGMSVAVTARYVDGWQRRTWRMIVRAGDGPFIPAVAGRVILRNPAEIEPGARPAVGLIPLERMVEGMQDLAVETDTLDMSLKPLFARHLGSDMARLPEAVQEAHRVYGPRVWAGRASVERGKAAWSRMIAWAFGFPQAADDIAVTVTMTPQRDGETWQRQFGDQVFRSHLKRNGAVMTEQFGPLTFTLDLHVADGQLHFPVQSGRLGPVPLPRVLLPKSVAREYQNEGRFCFDVALYAPVLGSLMVRYSGWLKRAAETGD